MSEAAAAEAVLVRAAQAGDRDAFTSLYDSYFSRIYDFCFQMVRNHDDAADLVSDVFLKAMERLSGLKDPEAFKGWLYAIARNAALTLIDKRGRTTSMPDDFEPSVVTPGTPFAPDPAESAERSELATLVWEAAATLNPRDYSIFDMTVRQGLESAEVAEALGVKPSHAYVLVSRLKDSVEEALGTVVMARAGRRDCSVLDSLVAGFGDERSPQMRKAVNRHIRKCDECSSNKLKYATAAAVLAGVAQAAPAHAGVKEQVAGRLAGLWPTHGPAAQSVASAAASPAGPEVHQAQPANGHGHLLARRGRLPRSWWAVPVGVLIFAAFAANQRSTPFDLGVGLSPVNEIAASPVLGATDAPDAGGLPTASPAAPAFLWPTIAPTPAPTPPPTARATRRPTVRPAATPRPAQHQQATPKPTPRATPRSTVIIITSPPKDAPPGGCGHNC